MGEAFVVDDIVDRIVGTWQRMSLGAAKVNESARDELASFVQTQFDRGLTDPDRLTVLGLTHLREMRQGNSAVRHANTGL